MDTDTFPTAAPMSSPSPSPAPVRTHDAGHIVAIVIGCLMLLPGLGILAGGGVAASAQAFATHDGYFRFTPDRVESGGVAITASDLWFDGSTDGDEPDWLLDHLDVDLRLSADAVGATDELFIGVARTADVDRYLAGREFSDVVEMNGRTPRYEERPGGRSIEPPSTQDFWFESATGSDAAVVTWEVRSGNWSLVVMNADGSPGVAADVQVGVRSGALMPIAIVMMVVGGLLLGGGVVLIVIGVRGRRVPRSGIGGPSAPLPPPTTPTAAPTDDFVAPST
jgi:hypothetical protein